MIYLLWLQWKFSAENTKSKELKDDN